MLLLVIDLSFKVMSRATCYKFKACIVIEFRKLTLNIIIIISKLYLVRNEQAVSTNQNIPARTKSTTGIYDVQQTHALKKAMIRWQKCQ